MRAILCIRLCPFEQTAVFLLHTLQPQQGLAVQSQIARPGVEELLKREHKEASSLRYFSSGSAGWRGLALSAETKHLCAG